jgi:hypothetical protein
MKRSISYCLINPLVLDPKEENKYTLSDIDDNWESDRTEYNFLWGKNSFTFLQRLKCKHLSIDNLARFFLLLFDLGDHFAYNSETSELKIANPPSTYQESDTSWDVKQRFKDLREMVKP